MTTSISTEPTSGEEIPRGAGGPQPGPAAAPAAPPTATTCPLSARFWTTHERAGCGYYEVVILDPYALEALMVPNCLPGPDRERLLRVRAMYLAGCCGESAIDLSDEDLELWHRMAEKAAAADMRGAAAWIRNHSEEVPEDQWPINLHRARQQAAKEAV